MLFPRSEIESLRAADGGGQIVVPTVVTPLSLLRAARHLFRRAQLFCEPAGSMAAGLGVAWSAAAGGDGRFRKLSAELQLAAAGDAPVFLGFSFRPDGPSSEEWGEFSSADVVVPIVAVVSSRDRNRLVLTPSVGTDVAELIDLLAGLDVPAAAGSFDPGDHSLVSRPATADWRSQVEEATEAINRGDLEKVVLSRTVVVTTDSPPEAFDLVDHLLDTYPQCYAFVWQVGDAVFVGATPELLLEKSGTRVRLNPLAGSARRGEGEAEDRAIGESLANSTKDRREHALVVEDIATRIEPFVESLETPSRPALRRMATVQHLSTEIAGEVKSGVELLDLVDVLHPTPAVGGTPRAAALRLVEKFEGIDRGWYTGGVGVLHEDGDGVIAIPLRCALIKGRVSYLYAGAGIVGDSTPQGELDETRLKFRPMLSLLTAT